MIGPSGACLDCEAPWRHRHFSWPNETDSLYPSLTVLDIFSADAAYTRDQIQITKTKPVSSSLYLLRKNAVFLYTFCIAEKGFMNALFVVEKSE